MTTTRKAAALSILHLAVGGAVYFHLITGGWLTTRYALDDPNAVNLVLALFEPIALLSVIAYWLRPNQARYRVVWILGLAQLAIVLGGILFFLVFALTWQPRMM